MNSANWHALRAAALQHITCNVSGIRCWSSDIVSRMRTRMELCLDMLRDTSTSPDARSIVCAALRTLQSAPSASAAACAACLRCCRRRSTVRKYVDFFCSRMWLYAMRSRLIVFDVSISASYFTLDIELNRGKNIDVLHRRQKQVGKSSLQLAHMDSHMVKPTSALHHMQVYRAARKRAERDMHVCALVRPKTLVLNLSC